MPEIYRWFYEMEAGGLAIVTGLVSRLVVLDFDDEWLALRFMLRFSRWCGETRVVRSAQRNLPHVYFRMPIGVTIPSRRLRGLDVQSDGRYIIVPPTTIGGKPYHVVNGGFPKELSRMEVDQLQRFIDELAAEEAEQLAAEAESVMSVTPKSELPRSRLRTAQECGNYYMSIASYLGRNNALFRTALMMRDSGWAHDDTLRVLQPLHTALARAGETAAQRERESAATVRSAFSRPPRPQPSTVPGLPNSLREALLSHRLVPLLRVLEGLVMHGVPAGALLTEKEVVEKLKGCVGRYSILQALQTSFKGELIFVVSSPFPTPHTPTNVALPSGIVEEKKCNTVGVTLSDKNRGRPPKRFQMPSLEHLCKLFGVRWTKSDPLERKDLQSPASYRRSLHREFVKRKPGTYHVKWFARRLNVADRTIRRYNRVCGVKVLPMFERYLVNRGMMHVIENSRPGMFLEDIRGRRYPCKVDIAKRLMRQGQRPRLCIQDYSLYTHPDGISLPPSLAQKPNPATKDPDSVFYVPPIDESTLLQKTPQKAAHAAAAAPQAPPTSRRSTPTVPHSAAPPASAPKPPRSFRRQLPDPSLEAAACRLYHHVRDLVAQGQGSGGSPLSMANARRLAFTYGVELLTRCQIILHQRGNIRNYAGFVVSFLSSEANVRRMQAASAACAPTGAACRSFKGG